MLRREPDLYLWWSNLVHVPFLLLFVLGNAIGVGLLYIAGWIVLDALICLDLYNVVVRLPAHHLGVELPPISPITWPCY